MRKRFLAVSTLAIVLALIASGTVQAQTTNHPLFTVLGVVNYQSLGTVFACTQTVDTPASVTIELYDSSDTLVATGVALPVTLRQTALFGTRTFAALSAQYGFQQAVPTDAEMSRASARIYSTSKSVMCSATVLDAVNSPPTSMTTLQVVAGRKQK
jgi:hypothetical protein